MKNKILEILREIDSVYDYEKSQDFFADGYLDSFDLTRLIAIFEDKFGISIGGDDLNADNFKSIPAMEALLARHGVKN